MDLAPGTVLVDYYRMLNDGRSNNIMVLDKTYKSESYSYLGPVPTKYTLIYIFIYSDLDP